MTNKNVLVGLIVVLIIAIIGSFFPKGNTVVQRVTEQLGNVVTLDGIDNPYTSINGFKEYRYSQGMNATSSVLCSIRNPYNASSTVASYSASVITAGGLGAVAQTLDLATSTSQYATTTTSAPLVQGFNTTAGPWSFAWFPQATTTTGTLYPGNRGLTPIVLGPTDYLILRIATTSTSGVFGSYYTGSCSASIRKL